MTQSVTADKRADVGDMKDIALRRKALALQELQNIEILLETIDKLNSNELGAPSSEIRILPAVKPGEFNGMRRVRAFEAYMRQRKGHRIPLVQIVADLLAGGVDPGVNRRATGSSAEERLAQNIKIGIGQPTSKLYGYSPEGKLFKVDPRDIIVWLNPEADNVPKARTRKK